MIIRSTTLPNGKPIARVVITARDSCYRCRKGSVVRDDGDELYVLLDDCSTPLLFERGEVQVLYEKTNPPIRSEGTAAEDR